ncbi:MAG: prepilin peptidase [Candidatus Methanosuratincola sp.]
MGGNRMILETKLIIFGAALAVASYQDLKTREIDDRIWLVSGAAGALLTVAEVITTPAYPLLLAGFSALLTAAIAVAVFYLGLYGGADAKALLVAAVTLPLSPWAVGTGPVWMPGSYTNPFFPLTLLGNGLLLSLLLVPSCFAWNLRARLSGEGLFDGVSASPLQRLVAVLTAVRVKPSTAASVHFNLIERPATPQPLRSGQGKSGSGSGRVTAARGLRGGSGAEEKWELKLFSRISDEDYDREKEEQSRALAGIDRKVWATPAIPMIVFLLAGYLVSLVWGDLIFSLISVLLGVHPAVWV